MPVALITGVAGFIGSQTAARLLAQGVTVRGIDNFDPYYDGKIKARNLAALLETDGFSFTELDLASAPLAPQLEGVDTIYHLAARAGVRGSWGQDFESYARPNILGTQRLLEAVRDRKIDKFVFASSSSVYGEGPGGMASESAPRRPISPYGVTKLAGEGLIQAYHINFGVPTVSLRYFTVYGPGQRPDMAFHRFIKSILRGQTLSVFGDGGQIRNYTYVSDVVTANLLAAEQGVPGGTYNIGGGEPVALNDVIATMERIAGCRAEKQYQDRQPGDPRITSADISLASRELGYKPTVKLEEGLDRMVSWMQALLAETEVGSGG
jgi:nucleoside-diphosphate-sugar epimerase